jgi:bifunctional non-homologous end joining protein LigD
MFSAETLRPMLASLPSSAPPLRDPDRVYEPKYDGIRAIALVEPATPAGGGRHRRRRSVEDARVRLWSRLGNEKTAQFPEIVAALGVWGRSLPGPVVLDGEIVALDASGRPAGFQRLQNRIHVTVPGYRSSKALVGPDHQPTAFIAFDLLRDADDDLRQRPLTDRRARLERLFGGHEPPSSTLRISEQVAGDGHALYLRAQEEGWEGLLVKRSRSIYQDGRRSAEWQKLKITKQDEFVVAGWTEPKGARAFFGSLILGRYDDAGHLVHAGDVGTGFSGAELERLWKLLKPAETPTCPFAVKPKTLGRPHWVTPRLVAQVRYTEVTDDGRLRHPAYLGLRDDKRARDVTTADIAQPAKRPTADQRTTAPQRSSRTTVRQPTGRAKRAAAAARRSPARSRDPLSVWDAHARALIAQIDELEQHGRDGKITLPDGDTLDVTNLRKVFWPAAKYTKGDLLRHYARISPLILPVIDERPLVMKRFPNGIEGQGFYQHRAPDVIPTGVRVERVPGTDVPAMFVGGGLKTLLYMGQLAAVSMDPWFSTVSDIEHADQVAIDLDPQPGATFAQIRDVARWVHDELERLGIAGYPKTSGSEGLHIFIPLPRGTTYEAGVLLCQIVATIVASRHPKVATIERMVKRRPDRTVYVDYLQNIQGKTLACAYSARASPFAGVSAPITWAEIDDRIAPEDFTIATIEGRVRAVGDLWAAMREGKPADLAGALERLQR